MKNKDELMKIFTKKQLATLLDNAWDKNTRLIKWLYDNYKNILREWEATQGKLRIEFLDTKKITKKREIRNDIT